MENKKSTQFGLGLLLGSIIGAITALFVTPKTGKEMRQLAKKWLDEELNKIKKEVGKIDKVKFKQAVKNVMKKVKKELKKETKEFNNIRNNLLKKWEKFSKEEKSK